MPNKKWLKQQGFVHSQPETQKQKTAKEENFNSSPLAFTS